MNPNRVVRMLGQDRPLDEIAAEQDGKPLVDYSIWQQEAGGYGYRAKHRGELGSIEGCADSRLEAIDLALEAKRRLETGLPG